MNFYIRIYYRVKTVYLLNLIEYDKEDAKDYLKRKIGWEIPIDKHCESTFTRFCQLIYQPKEINLTTEELIFHQIFV